MRKLIGSMMILFIAVPAFAAVELKTEDQKALYSLGALVARDLKGFNLSPEESQIVQQGFSDAIGGKTLATQPENYPDRIKQIAQNRMKVSSDKEKQLSQDFLDNAAKQKGARKTASGLIFVPVKAGTGKQPKATDTVKVHYTGRFIDGKIFDSSVQRGTPAEFPLNKVIPCWTEGVAMMKVGGKARLVCPSSIAYGDMGRPPVIPGGATLVFEIELLGVKK